MSKVININIYLTSFWVFECTFYLKLKFKPRIKSEFGIEIENRNLLSSGPKLQLLDPTTSLLVGPTFHCTTPAGWHAGPPN
jgi:hypothetical protein